MKTYRFSLDTDRLQTYGITARKTSRGVEFVMVGIGRKRQGVFELFLHYLVKGFIKIEEI